MQDYNPKDIEKKWQDIWEKNSIYITQNTTDKKNFYILDMFPYPSGEGLHVGHPRGYIATDVYSRFKRMHGYNVLHPMGWDAFGLPAENFAIKNKVHPRQAVDRNVARFKEQLSLIGPDYDWSREIDTTDPNFYKWTQWMFLKMYEKGLAYQSYEPINWCPGCQTGLANEDLESDGTCERCGSVVEKKPMRQWVLKITDYADRLLADLDTLPKWPEGVKEAQRNWIGKSEGAEITFYIENTEYEHEIGNVNVFTTRPDTLFGVSYIALAVDHPMVEHLLKNEISNWDKVYEYIQQVKQEDPFADNKITGIKLDGVVAKQSFIDDFEVPVYLTNYVLGSYGTGAVMGVPAHDERDFEFANTFGLQIKPVVVPENLFRAIVVTPTLENEVEFKEKLSENEINFTLSISAISKREHIRVELDNKKIDKFITLVQQHIKESGWVEILGTENILILKNKVHKNFTEDIDHWFAKFQEWEPFVRDQKSFWSMIGKNPFLNELICYQDEGILVNSDQFNGLTSEQAKQKITEFVSGKMKSTYRLKDWVFSRQRYWGEPIPMVFDVEGNVYPVDESELPVVLPDVTSYEPTGTGESPLAAIDDWVNVRGKITDKGTFVQDANGEMFRRETNTMPQWAGSSWYYLRYIDPKNNQSVIDSGKEKNWLPVDVYVGGDHATRHLIYARFWHKFLYDINVVSGLEPFPRLEFLGFIQAEDGRKMSKRWGNIVNPDDMVNRFGADAFRLYEMFIGPFENTVPWNTDGVVGTRRFLEKVWKQKEKIKDEDNQNLEMILHKTIKKISDDIEAFKFNTAVSHMMILVNEIAKEEYIGKNQYASLLQILAPFAPHITEEIWYTVFGEKNSIHLSIWPEYDASKIIESTIKIVVQVNGKVRGTIEVPIDTSEDEIKECAVSETKVEQYFTSEPEKVLYIPNRAINFIIKN